MAKVKTKRELIAEKKKLAQELEHSENQVRLWREDDEEIRKHLTHLLDPEYTDTHEVMGFRCSEHKDRILEWPQLYAEIGKVLGKLDYLDSQIQNANRVTQLENYANRLENQLAEREMNGRP